nr:MAK10-like protein [Tanacetum cinerariifolium]
ADQRRSTPVNAVEPGLTTTVYGGDRWSMVTVNDGHPWRTIAGPPLTITGPSVNGGSPTVNPRVIGRVMLGHGPGLPRSIFSLCYLFRKSFSSTTIRDANHVRTLGDYSKPSHEGYRNTIELLVGNNVVPLRSNTIRIYHHMGGSYYSFSSLILSTRKDRKTPQPYPDVPTTSRKISLRSMDSFQGLTTKIPSSWHRPLAPNLTLYDNESWNDPSDFAKPVKAISLTQDVPSTSDRCLIELENQVQRLMKAHIAPMQHTQVNKITSSYEICSGPHDNQYCMENPEQDFVEYASLHIDETGSWQFAMNQGPRNFNKAANAWK